MAVIPQISRFAGSLFNLAALFHSFPSLICEEKHVDGFSFYDLSESWPGVGHPVCRSAASGAGRGCSDHPSHTRRSGNPFGWRGEI
jgi:hypothetical protein